MAATPMAISGSLQSSARLSELRAQRRKPGEASFFFYDAHFRSEAVKVLPGEYFVHDQDNILIMTTLGSCIAACLWDRDRRLGGMNHFMLPDAGDGARYGLYAMELLINELMKRGATRSSLEAKVFGGGAVLGGMTTLNVGERNTRFVLDYLKTERIPVVSSDVLDVYPRKVCFEPASGRAKVKRLAPTAMGEQLLAQERAAAKAVPSDAGSIELF